MWKTQLRQRPRNFLLRKLPKPLPNKPDQEVEDVVDSEIIVAVGKGTKGSLGKGNNVGDNFDFVVNIHIYCGAGRLTVNKMGNFLVYFQSWEK